MSIEIKEVTTKRQLKKFVSFPYKLYSTDPFYVPPLRFDELGTLRSDKNPAFDYCEVHYWLAYKNGKIAGRIAAILNHSFIEKWGKKYLRFGWFDFIQDKEVASSLLAKVENWAKELGMVAVHGPLGFTDLDHEGTLVEGFNELGTLATIYNYPYYPELIEECGFKKDTDWVEYQIKVPKTVPEKVERIADIVEKKYGLKVVRAKKAKDILPYTTEVFNLINSTYEKLYGVVLLTERQIRYYVKQYFSFIRTDFVVIILDKDEKLAGFGITMPSLSRALQKSNGRLFPFGFIHILKALKKNNMADMYLVAIRPDMQDKGVNAILMREITKSYIKNDIKIAESNPELEDNLKVQSIWNYYDARCHKRRRCYIKYLESEPA